MTDKKLQNSYLSVLFQAADDASIEEQSNYYLAL